MSVLHNILTGLDAKLDSMIQHPVWFGSLVTDDADKKMREFTYMCKNDAISSQEIQKVLDDWLKDYDAEQKREFCLRMYGGTPRRGWGVEIGRPIMEEYCEAKDIALNK